MGIVRRGNRDESDVREVSAPSDICAEDSQDLFRAKFIKWDKILCEWNLQAALIGVVSFTGYLQKMQCF